MNRAILLIFVCAIVGAGVFAGLVGLVTGVNTGWKPFNYITVNGECWVHPQGDPLYDEHYAKNVNLPNCQAFETQEQGKRLQADTRRINVETTQGITLVYTLFGILAIILVLIVTMSIRGQNGTA